MTFNLNETLPRQNCLWFQPIHTCCDPADLPYTSLGGSGPSYRSYTTPPNALLAGFPASVKPLQLNQMLQQEWSLKVALYLNSIL